MLRPTLRLLKERNYFFATSSSFFCCLFVCHFLRVILKIYPVEVLFYVAAVKIENGIPKLCKKKNDFVLLQGVTQLNRESLRIPIN